MRDKTKLARKLGSRPDVHRIRRPVTPAGAREFDLAYVRSGPRTDRPILILPGGPGMASLLPYRRLRPAAAARGLDVIMVEHRGVGLSRQDLEGVDLPPEALTVDQVVADLVAVLDDCGVEEVVVYGTSYGTYLAQGLGVRDPDRVVGMVLDSPMLTARDDETVRDNLRALLWDGVRPETAEAARLMREAIASGAVPVDESGAVAQLVYEVAGPQTLTRLLALRLNGRGRRTWNRLLGLGRDEINTVHRYSMEFDLVGVIAFRETGGYAPRPDGRPLDVNLAYGELARNYPAFAGEPYNLTAELPSFRWPTAVVSGERDLRTPRPVAERIVELIPDAVLVPLAGTGHSALDTHQTAAFHVAHAVHAKAHRHLPGLADRIAALPRRGPTQLFGPLVTAAVTTEEWLPRRFS